MLADQIPEGWVPSEREPGYYVKTIQCGNATVNILRPILSPEEQAKREAELMAANDRFILACERHAKMEVSA